MRRDSIRFAVADQSADRRPRYVIRIEFPTASLYCTSHDDIPNVPGVPIEGVLKEPSAISQRLVPDEGRSEIGSFSFSLIDLEGIFTDAVGSHIADDEGLRGREVRFYVGYEGFDFTDFQVFTTQIVVSDSVKDSVYTVQCRDITREQNKEIFKPVATTLRLSCSATETAIAVGDTTAFEFIAHGTSYSDAPSLTVLYFRLEDEIIRATGKTANTFTGCTRGVLNTVAKPHAISDSASQDRQPKIEEYIYLEMPGPMLARAILTGEIYGTANVLPDHWHLGIDPGYVRDSDFTGIGLDLWNPGDDTDSLILRFEGLRAQDGKRFVEKEIYLLLGCFSPVYSDGTLGLRRMSPLISSAGPTVTLTEATVCELGALEHDGESMHNQFRINWAWDSLLEDYIRESRFIDAISEEVHGASPLLTYEFRGLHGERHTDITIAQRLASIRDRYSTPPERINVTVFGSLNRIEIGDIVRLKLGSEFLRDYYETDSIDFNRSFEVHQQTYNAAAGEVTLELFGSTIRPLAQPPAASSFSALSDAWYSSEGTALSSVLTIVGNVVQPGTYTLTGNASLRNTAAIFYHANDLTIADGAVINTVANVQLRIRGFLQNNGDIVGTGGGRAGVIDSGSAITQPIAGTAGYIGNSRGWDGMKHRLASHGRVTAADTIPSALTRGLVDAVPVFEINAEGGVLSGIPADLRGTGGAPGGRLLRGDGFIHSVGGTGGNGGAGLLIVCRGIALGASGSIVLDGANTTAPAPLEADYDYYAGAGGGGGPGAMLVLLDGSGISFPIISGKFFARGGTVAVPGTPLPRRTDNNLASREFTGTVAFVGYADPDAVALSGHDYSQVAYGIQYIAESIDPENDQNPRPPTPTDLRAASTAGGNLLTWTAPDSDSYTVIEVYSSITNDRSDATFAGEVKGSAYTHLLPLGERRYYWVRSSRTYADNRAPLRSDFEPSSATGGVVSNAETPGETPDSPGDFFAVGQVNGIRFSWAMPAVGRLLGRVRLYEGTTATAFDDDEAVMIFDGYAFAYTHARTDTTTRYYWIQLYRGGEFSDVNGDGLPAAATSVTAQLTATILSVDPTVNAGQGLSPKIITTGLQTISGSGGVPPYTLGWSITAFNGNLVYPESDIVINNPAGASTTVSATGSFTGQKKQVVLRGTVTDSLGFSASADAVLNFYWPRPRVIF